MENEVAVSGADVAGSNTSAADMGETSSGVSDRRSGAQKLSQEEKVNPPKEARSLSPLANMINKERAAFDQAGASDNAES